MIKTSWSTLQKTPTFKDIPAMEVAIIRHMIIKERWKGIIIGALCVSSGAVLAYIFFLTQYSVTS